MADKKDYEVAVEEFEKADAEYKELETSIIEGTFLVEIYATCGGNIEKARLDWASRLQKLKTLLEERNVKLKSAKDAIRQAVHLNPTQWRGPEGKADELKCKSFTVSSVTHRGFDPDSLFNLTKQHGLLERLLELDKVNKDGKREKLVEHSWTIDYPGVLAWLRSNKLDAIVEGAYDEHEKTPQVRGPKELAFLGETKKGD